MCCLNTAQYRVTRTCRAKKKYIRVGIEQVSLKGQHNVTEEEERYKGTKPRFPVDRVRCFSFFFFSFFFQYRFNWTDPDRKHVDWTCQTERRLASCYLSQEDRIGPRLWSMEHTCFILKSLVPFFFSLSIHFNRRFLRLLFHFISFVSRWRATIRNCFRNN